MVATPFLPSWGGALLGARKEQQDAFLTDDLTESGGFLAIVADGMGGHAAGGLASRIATSEFRDCFVKQMAETGEISAALDGAVHAANGAIQKAQKGFPERSGMGTTLLAVYVSSRGLSWISVGDSPLLLCRDGDVLRLNEDHSLRSLPEYTGAHGNMLRSALTGQEVALIDHHAEPMDLRQGDIVLLASDGLLTLEPSDVIALTSAEENSRPEAIGQSLLDAVSQKADPKQDNCTVVAFAPPSTASARSQPAATSAVPPSRPFVFGPVLVLCCIAIALAAAAIIALLW